MAKGLKGAFDVEWVAVTYKSVGLIVAIALGLGAVGGGIWFYLHRFTPKEDALGAIHRADLRLEEATALEPRPAGAEEILARAQGSLEEARQQFGDTRYDAAQVAAMRSEDLSAKALALAEGNPKDTHVVQFLRIEGDVRVKPAGEFSWHSADLKVVLRIGDQVKTSSSGSAELIYFDETKTIIRPGSLLEIRDLYEDPVTKVRRVAERLNWGAVEASTQKRNVSGSYHEVTTEKVNTRAEEEGEFRVAYNKDKQTSVINVFEGRVQVATGSARETVDAGERVRAEASGALSAKESLPGVPRLLAPSDQRVFVFEKPEEEPFTLTWEPVPGAARYHLMIADQALFAQPMCDQERAETSVVIDGVPEGSFYWRIAAISKAGLPGPYSEVRRFRVTSQRIRDHTDNQPPRLDIDEFVPVGQMVIINGRTEPGAVLWVNESKIDVFDDGSFNAVVRLQRDGLNELVFLAQDGAGNETRVKRSLYVEVF